MRYDARKPVYFDTQRSGYANRIRYFGLAIVASLLMWLAIIAASLQLI